MKKSILIIIASVLLLGLVGWRVEQSTTVRQWWYDLTKPKLPVAENLLQASVSHTNTAFKANENVNANQVSLPPEKNLAVPFTTQAPNASWDADHEEFCEEATVVMASRFFRHQSIASATDAETALQQLKQWELDNLGFYFDTTAEETATMIRGVYGLSVTLKENPTIDEIKHAVADDKLVIVPAAGRQLGNPNFKSPGPMYHNVVIRGYTKDGKFITNDPGTRKGEAYVYSQDVVMNAMHDWVPRGGRTMAANGDANGRKVILIVSS